MTFCREQDYADMQQVEAEHTDVVAIEPVEGGWALFTDAQDYEVWQAQQ